MHLASWHYRVEACLALQIRSHKLVEGNRSIISKFETVNKIILLLMLLMFIIKALSVQ